MGEVLSEQQRAFLEASHGAVMATVDDLGRPHAVPVLCALVDGELWSSGTDLRVRTRHLEARPSATLTVLTSGFWGEWLSVGGRVEIRRDARVEDNLRLYRVATGHEPTTLRSTAPRWSPSVAWSTCSPPSGPTRRRAEEDCWHG
jgi:PPOX class probable F420-dependent enzyme